MAQHDMNIANQGFPAFRTDLNNALSAIQSMHSGSSRPSGAVSGQMWLDTTNATSPTIKFFDGTDDISFATIDYTANTVNFLDSTVSTELVNDTSPQLGGNLDTNGNNIQFDNATAITDDSGNEQLVFNKTASAVNQVEITNQSTGVAPSIDANGTDTNVGLNIGTKGIGFVKLNNMSSIEAIKERVTNSATAFTGTINFDVITQAVFNATSNASANWTLNIRGDGSNSLDSIMDNGDSFTIVTAVPQGGTAYYNSAVTIDGVSVTPKWQGGSAPTAGNASSIDTYTYTIIKTASATFTVLASQTQFA